MEISITNVSLNMIIIFFVYLEFISYIINIEYIQTQISEIIKNSVRYVFQLIYQECLQQFRSNLYHKNKSS